MWIIGLTYMCFLMSLTRGCTLKKIPRRQEFPSNVQSTEEDLGGKLNKEGAGKLGSY